MKLSSVSKIIQNRRAQTWGRCLVCGKHSFFFTKDAQERGHVRESLFCVRCKSVSRKRHVVKVILDLFAPAARSLAEARGALEQLSIFSAVTNDAFHKVIGAGNPRFVCSEYFENVRPGEQYQGVTCQDLEQLTFADATFDVVITEDVLEHVRRPGQAFREIRRVLKAGGLHIFTVPFHFDRKTATRVKPSRNGDVHCLPPEYHGDTLREKILVYTDFGYEMFDDLAQLGFETTVSCAMHSDFIRYAIADSCVFISKKI